MGEEATGSWERQDEPDLFQECGGKQSEKSNIADPELHSLKLQIQGKQEF